MAVSGCDASSYPWCPQLDGDGQDRVARTAMLHTVVPYMPGSVLVIAYPLVAGRML